MHANDIRAQRCKLRFSTKIGLIRQMWQNGIMTTNQAIRAIFS